MYRIVIQAESKRAFVPPAAKIRQWAKAALRHKRRKGEVTVRLVQPKEIQALNKAYRHKDKATNILSFPADLPEEVQSKIPLIGDLVICSEIVNREALEQNKTQEAHWAHIIIHGCLHLLGYDHETEPEAEVMEGKEIRVLKTLGFSNPYQ